VAQGGVLQGEWHERRLLGLRHAERHGPDGGSGAYGTFDMSGNVFEWNDLDEATGSSRGLRGGDFFNDASILPSSSRETSVAAILGKGASHQNWVSRRVAHIWWLSPFPPGC
jgi:formylglycine-generating enzyme required for sulfatase activity